MVSVNARLLTALISLSGRYITDIAISLTTSFQHQASATLACLLTTCLQTRLSLCLVGNFIILKFCWLTVVLGWSLFAAAMTTNQGLRTELISRVHKRASTSTIIGVFPLNYGSVDGSTLQGVAR